VVTPEDKALEARCRRALDKQGVTMRRVHSKARRSGGTYSLTVCLATSGRTRVLCKGLSLAELEEAASLGALLYAKVLRAKRADERARAELELQAQQADERARVARIERDAMERRLRVFEAHQAEQERLAQAKEQRHGRFGRHKAS
jgi:hypothetical protein